jgi:thiol-disulfide isomerase/thioredoxin
MPATAGNFTSLREVYLSDQRAGKEVKMIDKNAGGDKENPMPNMKKVSWIIGGILALLLLAAGLQPALAQVKDGNAGRSGQTLDINSLLAPNRTTVVDFFSPYCPPCMMLAPLMEKLAAKQPEVSFVKVNINRPQVQGIDWKSPLAQQYNIRSVPCFMIYNSQGKLMAEGEGARKTVVDWLEKAGLLPQQ